MRILRLQAIATISCAILGIMASSTANAQAYKVETSNLEFDDLPSPAFGGVKNKAFKPKDWLEIEASFKIQMKPEAPSKTAERILVKWYIAVKHPEKRGALLLLTKDITHVNIPLNEEIYSSVYLSPASIRRLTGSDRAGKGSVEFVGYEILVNGEKVAQETNKKVKGKTDWWNIASATISRSDTVPLLNKMETPFANMWWDRYAEILVERR
ncbi:MAG: Amuc_1102 family pilus-like protein [Akkermansiaceae bacterium]